MPENKLRLPCPICETRLDLDPQLDQTICPTCKAELKIVRTDGVAALEPVLEPIKLTPVQRELVEVHNQLRTKDDNYGAGCAVATIAITLVICIGIIVSGILKSGVLFLASIVLGIVILFVVLYLFVGASSKATLPLVQRSQELQVALQQPPTIPEPAEPKPKPQAQG